MKRVLVLDYYFPPLGGVGPQRTVKFIKHFRALGYEPVVLTGPEGSVDAIAPPDPTLAAEVPAGILIERIRTPRPSPGRLRSRMSRLLGRMGAFEDWWKREATPLARSIAGDVDLIYAGMAPFSSAEVAAKVADEVDVPWVADLADPWALDDWWIYPTALHRRLDRWRMRRCLRTAAAVVMNTPEAARALVSHFPELVDRPITSISWGWDADDFRGMPEPRMDGRFRIVYAGYSHVQRGWEHRARRRIREAFGGAVRGMDILPRSHAFLAEAIARLDDHDEELARRIELHVAGPAPVEDGVTSRGSSIVHHGFVPHDRAVALMRSADLLFLALHDLPPGIRATTVPGKTYEYLASGRPILAALPEGDARDLLATLPHVRLCRPTDIECMTAALREAMGTTFEDSDRLADVLERTEWRNLARELTGLFDQALSEVPRL